MAQHKGWRGRTGDRAGAACVTPPCTASPASPLTAAGSDVRAAAHSHCHTAQTWHGSIQGHRPARKPRQKTQPHTIPDGGDASAEPASQPGGLYLQVSGSANRTAAHKKLLLEKPGVQLRNTKPIKLNKCLVWNEKKQTPKWHRNGGSWEQQPVCGLTTWTPKQSAYFSWEQL